MTKRVATIFLVLGLQLLFGQTARQATTVSLPTSKKLTVPAPGSLSVLNGFPATIVVSPDGHHAAILNDGYGAENNQSHQSITVIDLKTNQLADFPENRLLEEARHRPNCCTGTTAPSSTTSYGVTRERPRELKQQDLSAEAEGNAA